MERFAAVRWQPHGYANAIHGIRADLTRSRKNRIKPVLPLLPVAATPEFLITD
jgi:hypothetical protein